MIIAIDGPAASGKGTLARRLAAHFGFAHLDTGKLYRAAALHALESGGDPDDADVAEAAARKVRAGDLGDPRLLDERVAQAASVVAAIPGVRAALAAFQRDFAHHPPGGAGAVLDGRDIGTVICPNAEAKFFVTASPEARARRRHKELRDAGESAIYERVLQDMKNRDARDSARRTAPLVPADDAFVVDTTALDADAVFAMALDHIGRLHAGKTPPRS
jgi:cytidylate kinase